MEPSLRERLTLQVIARAKLPLAEEWEELEGSLIDFVEAAWPSLDPSAFQASWAIEAICEHLQAVTEGQIRKLLVNVPPRCGKTLVTSVCFPAWTWARAERSYLSGPQVRFLCGSYNDDLSLQNSTKHRQLLLSPWYQKYWGKRFKLTPEQNTKSHFNTSAGGSRISTSARGSLLGVGGDLVLIDDPQNMLSVESDAERLTARTWWREISTTRLNDPKQSAIVVIMQRLHEEDVSGVILSSEWGSEWTHLMVPMQCEWRRHCVTSLGWQDPRGLDDNGNSLVAVERSGERLPRDHEAALELEKREGALTWPERFGAREIELIKTELRPYMASGRLQQSPTPAINHPSLGRFCLVCTPNDVVTHIANGKNCPVANSKPPFAYFVRGRLPILEGSDVLFSQSDRSIDASAIGILISFCLFRLDGSIKHGDTPMREWAHQNVP
jgi:hypothetical protein